ncbi:hypothetical protein [Dolosigranulum pigrum]|jgi:hypothetical protein|uniref:hypothetical protein n=1 Tax=Dolosigranulum pigrum TaxID=29394 RepID=UPI001AD8762C|nr:hypothetical protein [Dolosigranulum pigrum]
MNFVLNIESMTDPKSVLLSKITTTSDNFIFSNDDIALIDTNLTNFWERVHDGEYIIIP